MGPKRDLDFCLRQREGGGVPPHVLPHPQSSSTSSAFSLPRPRTFKGQSRKERPRTPHLSVRSLFTRAPTSNPTAVLLPTWGSPGYAEGDPATLFLHISARLGSSPASSLLSCHFHEAHPDHPLLKHHLSHHLALTVDFVLFFLCIPYHFLTYCEDIFSQRGPQQHRPTCSFTIDLSIPCLQLRANSRLLESTTCKHQESKCFAYFD